MRLGSIRKELCILLIGGMLSYPILGVEVAPTEEVAVSTTSVSQKAEESTQLSELGLLKSREGELEVIREHGKTINLSMVKDHLKITVESVLTDAYGTKLLISVEALEGATFKSKENIHIERIDLNSKKELEIQKRLEAIPSGAPYIEYLKVMAEFEKGLNDFIKADNTIDEEGLMDYLEQEQNYSLGSASASYEQCYTKESTNKKVYFIYRASFGEASPEDMVLSMESVVEEEERKEDITTDVVGYLTKHGNAVLKTVPNVIDEHEIKYLEELKQTNETLYLSRKEELEQEPKILLGRQGLGLSVIEGDKSLVIDNIGFIEGKLHVLIIDKGENSHYLELFNEVDEWMNSSYHTTSGRKLEDGQFESEQYYVYDIHSVEELKKYKIRVNRTETINTWKGPWEINLNRGSDKGQIIKVNKKIPYAVKKEVKLKEVYIGDCSIALFIDEVNHKLNNEDLGIKIHYKDGTVEELTHSRASSRKSNQQIMVYQMRNQVGKNIQSMVIGNNIVYSVSS